MFGVGCGLAEAPSPALGGGPARRPRRDRVGVENPEVHHPSVLPIGDEDADRLGTLVIESRQQLGSELCHRDGLSVRA